MPDPSAPLKRAVDRLRDDMRRVCRDDPGASARLAASLPVAERELARFRLPQEQAAWKKLELDARRAMEAYLAAPPAPNPGAALAAVAAACNRAEAARARLLHTTAIAKGAR